MHPPRPVVPPDTAVDWILNVEVALPAIIVVPSPPTANVAPGVVVLIPTRVVLVFHFNKGMFALEVAKVHAFAFAEGIVVVPAFTNVVDAALIVRVVSTTSTEVEAMLPKEATVVVAADVVEFATERFLMVEDAVSAKSGPEKYARPVVVAFVVVEFTVVKFVMVELAVLATKAELMVSESAYASPIVMSPYVVIAPVKSAVVDA